MVNSEQSSVSGRPEVSDRQLAKSYQQSARAGTSAATTYI